MQAIQSWSNPLPGRVGTDLELIFESLTKWLESPTFLNGITVGNGNGTQTGDGSGVSTTTINSNPTTSAPTDTSAPGTPTVTALGGIRSILAYWPAVTTANGSNVASYVAEVATDSAFTSVVQTLHPVGPVVSFDDLSANTTYYVRVAAVSYYGTQGSWSTTVSATTPQLISSDIGTGSVTTTNLAYYQDTSAPGTPSLTLVPSIRSLMCHWPAVTTANGSPVASYVAEVATDSGFTSIVQTLDPTGPWVTFENLAAATTYYVRVAAVSYHGTQGPWSAVGSATTPQLISTDLAVGSVGSTEMAIYQDTSAVGAPSVLLLAGLQSVVAYWAAVTTANGSAVDSYTAEIATDSAFTSIVQTLHPTGPVASFGGLASNTTYYVRVSATSFGGVTGAWSVTQSVTTPRALTADIAPGAVTGSIIATGTVTGSNIAAGTVTGSNIGSATITGGNIAASTITSGNIAAGAVTSTQLAYYQDTSAPATPAVTLVAGIRSLMAYWSSVTTANGSPVENYVAEVATDSAFTNIVQTLDPTGPWVTFNDLNSNTLYYVRVAAVSYHGTQGAWSVTQSATTPQVIAADIGSGAVTSTQLAYYQDSSAPGTPAVTLVAGIRSMMAYWAAITTANGSPVASYVAEIATDSAFTSIVETLHPTGPFATFDNLATGTTYYVRVAAVSYFGTTGAWSTTQSAAPPQAVSGDLAANSVTATQIAAGAVTTSALAAGAVTAAKITAGTITTTQIAAGTITGSNIAAGTITASNIAASTITASQIASATITGAQIAGGTITAANIEAATITGTQIAAATIAGSNIVAGTITGSLIAAATIVGSNIAANTITAGNITANTITAAQIAANTITAAQIAANTITAGQIAANTITAAQIAANTITSSQIAAGTITAAQIASGTITGTQIAGSTITAANIAANTITAAQIAAGTITAGSAIIANGAISSAQIASLAANQITAGTINAQTIQLGATGGTAALQSTNYATGSAGWAIKGDGTAEFNSVNVYGGLLEVGPSTGSQVKVWESGTVGEIDFLYNSTLVGRLKTINASTISLEQSSGNSKLHLYSGNSLFIGDDVNNVGMFLDGNGNVDLTYNTAGGMVMVNGWQIVGAATSPSTATVPVIQGGNATITTNSSGQAAIGYSFLHGTIAVVVCNNYAGTAANILFSVVGSNANGVTVQAVHSETGAAWTNATMVVSWFAYGF